MTCPSDPAHETFTDWVWEGSTTRLKKVYFEACPTCKHIWYKD